MALSAPWVVGPITPCSRKIKLEGLLARGIVHIMAGGSEVAVAGAERPDQLIELKAGVKLQPNWNVTAWQERAGDKSAESPIPYTVLDYPTKAALGELFLLAPAVQCGTCLGLGGIVPGSTVEVIFPGRAPITATADWAEVHVEVPGGIPLLLPTETFTVQQTACSAGPRLQGPLVPFPPPLKQHNAGHPLPPPLFESRLYECQKLLRFTGVQPGAQIKLEYNEATPYPGSISACSGGADGDIFLSKDMLVAKKHTEIAQEYKLGELCDREGETDDHVVRDGPPDAPWFEELPSPGHPFVTIGGLVSGATVHIFDESGQLLVVGAATRRVSAINMPATWNARQLTVRQFLCDLLLSEPGTIDVVPGVDPPPPLLVEGYRFDKGANAVCVQVLGQAESEPGFSPGTHVRLFSRLWRGVIGEAIASGDHFSDLSLGDHFTDVHLWLPLVDGDRITAEAMRCGATRNSDEIVVDTGPGLKSPGMNSEVDDVGGSVWVMAQPGVMVDLDRVDANTFDPDTAGVLLASVRVTRRDMPLPIPPLPRDALVRVRARLGGNRSAPSDIRTVKDLGLAYDADSAFRICQLTGASDPLSRPHLNDTRDVGLVGTDLGAPVDHGGKVWLFFGDAKGFKFLDKDWLGDQDPFGWTTDRPEPDGPRLHIVADDTNFFFGLLDDALAAATGGVLGGLLGYLAGGVAVALAAGIGLAAIGAIVGYFLEFIPSREFRRLAVDDLPELGNFEVPSGGFSYEDRLYLFLARHKQETDDERMHVSHLAVSKTADPADNFKKLEDVSSTLPGDSYPAGPWLVQASPTVVRNSEVPGLPSKMGDGLVVFGSGLYKNSNLRVAWAPLTKGQPPPSPGGWQFWADTPLGPKWRTASQMAAENIGPRQLLRDDSDQPDPDDTVTPPAGTPRPPGLAELSASWSPALQRWILTDAFFGHRVDFRVAREPGGKWTRRAEIFNPANPLANADNGPPDGPHVWVGKVPGDKTSPLYAAYHVPRWLHFDRSTRKLTIYYVLSVWHTLYNPQLMRARLTCE